ncbi:hypothetical protein BDY24DRAFT_383518 [Mrakia frigida]|uniref:uncharacterized protein n=1 Tax=Mrakia frigida TaxID=29902 RepID=UPI003FCC0F91
MELDIPESSGSTPQPKLEPLYPDNLEDVSDTDSLVTIDSSTKSDLYTIRNGRGHQALNEDVYTWAVDGEAAKLELLLGSVLSLTFPSGLCFEPSHGALAEVLTGLGEGRILDVGSGVVGDWALKMGESFPRSQVIGVDLVPSETEFAPSNVSFEVHDISEGLPYPLQSGSILLIDSSPRPLRCRPPSPFRSRSLPRSRWSPPHLRAQQPPLKSHTQQPFPRTSPRPSGTRSTLLPRRRSSEMVPRDLLPSNSPWSFRRSGGSLG